MIGFYYPHCKVEETETQRTKKLTHSGIDTVEETEWGLDSVCLVQGPVLGPHDAFSYTSLLSKNNLLLSFYLLKHKSFSSIFFNHKKNVQKYDLLLCLISSNNGSGILDIDLDASFYLRFFESTYHYNAYALRQIYETCFKKER